jgi:ribosomal-protein-alanine N-acetyltransferase
LGEEVIETSRLILRPLCWDDLDALAVMYADEETCRFVGGVKTREGTARLLERVITNHQKHGFGMLAVVDRSSGRLLGRAGFLPQIVEGAHEVELAYLIERASWGRGLATEAAAALRDWGHANLPEPRLISLIHFANYASKRVAERVGSRWLRDVEYEGARVHLYVNERSAPRG